MTASGNHKRLLKPLLGLCITGGALYLVIRKLDWSSVAAQAANASPAWIAAAIGALALGYLARIVRWWLMLRFLNASLRVRDAAGPFLASMALNNVLPLRAGDVARTFAYKEQLGIAPAQMIGTLFLERLLDLLGLLVMFFIGMRGLALSGPLAATRTTAIWLTGAGLVALILTIIAPGIIRRIVDALMVHGPLSRLPLAGKIAELAGHVLDSLHVLRSPAVVLALMALTLSAWALEGAMYGMIAAATAADVSPGAALFALATGNLATLIPSSPGYVGTFDYFVILALEAYGMTTQKAGATALMIHTGLWLPITASGLLYILFSRRSGPGLSPDREPASNSA